MNFFEQQDRAQKRSRNLVALFILAVACIIAVLYMAAALGFSANSRKMDWWNPELFAAVALGTLFVITLGSLWKTWRLSKGGRVVAEMLGGQLVPTNADDPDLVKLRNVVEEMAIASGTPVPAIYVMPDEPAINAFAAGFTPTDAAIGVTRGCIEKLTRDELQGVIAHEFSHILNGDMRLNIRLMGLLNGILLIGLAGYFLLRSLAFGGRSRSRRSGGGGGGILAILAVALTMIVVGFVGVFFGRLIKAAVSRQREYLADASAVQYTRNPSGIAGALKKIGGFSSGSRLQTSHAPEASHLFFGDGIKKRFLFANMLSTHPPLDVRIRAIDPSFDGELEQYESSYHAPSSPALGLAPTAPKPAVDKPLTTTPSRIVDEVGTLTPELVAYGATLLESIPETIKASAREPFGAQAVIYCLLLDEEQEIVDAQMKALEGSADAAIVRETVELAPQVALLDRELRLPLVDLALAALRQLSLNQFETFRQNVQVLIEADRKLDLFEFTLQKILLRHLRRTYESQKHIAQFHSLKALVNESRLMLATVAYSGHGEVADAQAAYAAATNIIGDPAAGIEMPPASSCKLSTFDYALDRLELASPPVKQKLLEAVATCVAHDGEITQAEGELLRAIADGLDCPMPPIIRS